MKVDFVAEGMRQRNVIARPLNLPPEPLPVWRWIAGAVVTLIAAVIFFAAWVAIGALGRWGR